MDKLWQERAFILLAQAPVEPYDLLVQIVRNRWCNRERRALTNRRRALVTKQIADTNTLLGPKALEKRTRIDLWHLYFNPLVLAMQATQAALLKAVGLVSFTSQGPIMTSMDSTILGLSPLHRLDPLIHGMVLPSWHTLCVFDRFAIGKIDQVR